MERSTRSTPRRAIHLGKSSACREQATQQEAVSTKLIRQGPPSRNRTAVLPQVAWTQPSIRGVITRRRRSSIMEPIRLEITIPATSQQGHLRLVMDSLEQMAGSPCSQVWEQGVRHFIRCSPEQRYFNLSINAAVAKYAPSMENNTAGYQQFLTNVLGVSGNTPLSSLSPATVPKA